MPTSAYFEGHGSDVMRSMKKAHPGYSKKRLKGEFYATANTRGMKPATHLPEGTSQSPTGDLGYARQEEAIALGTFKGAVCRHMNLPVRPVRKARD